MSDVLGIITIKQQDDGSWSYDFKNIRENDVIAHLEQMKFLIISGKIKWKRVNKLNPSEK